MRGVFYFLFALFFISFSSAGWFSDFFGITGNSIQSDSLVPVYRFYNNNTGTHFYTISEGEKDKLITQYSNVYIFEGPKFYVYKIQAENTVPVYRFYNNNTGTHFYTISEGEKDKLITQYSNVYIFEGPKFYVYKESIPILIKENKLVYKWAFEDDLIDSIDNLNGEGNNVVFTKGAESIGLNFKERSFVTFDLESPNESTISFWINLQNISTGSIIIYEDGFFKLAAEKDERSIGNLYGEKLNLTVYYENISGKMAFSSEQLWVEFGKWNCITFVYSDGIFRIYFNGDVFRNIRLNNFKRWVFPEELVAGNNWGDSLYDLKFDELKIWNYVLNETEIFNDYYGVKKEITYALNVDASLATTKDIYLVGENIELTDPPEKVIDNNTTEFVEGEVLIELKGVDIKEKNFLSKGIVYVKDFVGIDDSMIKSNSSSLNDALKKNRARGFRVVNSKMVVIKVDNTSKAIKDFKKSESIEVVQPNFIYRPFSIPNDSLYQYQWALRDYSSVWDIEKGSSDVVVAVIDTGVDYNHEDLRRNIWINEDEISGNGVDDDDNGFIDDVYGWDFLDDDNEPMDDYGHGTHCAGVIAAESFNGKGIVGVCPNCRIMSIKFLGLDGGTTEDSIKSVIYAIDNGAKIISNSWGGSWSGSEEDILLGRVIKEAFDKNITVIAAAGNGRDDKVSYPAGYNGVISVGAVGKNGAVTFYSNFGHTVDVSAPGGELDYNCQLDYSDCCSYTNDISILSSVSEGELWNELGNCGISNSGKYMPLSGTSMSCPYVAGFAGLLLSKEQNLTPMGIEQIIKKSVDAPYSNVYIGSGILNLTKGMEATFSDSVARITYPLRDSLVSENIVIEGNVNGERYKLYYGRGLYPREWVEISSGDLAGEYFGKELGSLDFSNMNCSKYALKLVVEDEDGGYNEDVVPINVKNENCVNLPEIQISSNIYDESNPKIYGDKIIWTDNRDMLNIHLYDLATFREEQLTDGFFNSGADIFNDTIVWEMTGMSGGDVYMKKIGEEEIIIASGDAIFDGVSYLHPAIWGNKVVFQRKYDGNSDIVVYDLNTKKISNVTVDSFNQIYSDIYGDKIVWQDDRNGNWDIYMFDLSTNLEKMITTDSSDQIGVDIYGDKIVWQDDRNRNWDIYMFDLSNNQETRITNNDYDQYSPSIWENKIVWQDDRNGNSDIYYYDLDKQEEMAFATDEVSQQVAPDIFNNTIVWQDDRNGRIDIYLKNLDGTIQRPQSRIDNKENFQIIGNLIMKIQKEESGNWQDMREVVNREVIILPGSIIKLDKEWNSQVVTVNFVGNYRVVLSLETSYGHIEKTFEFKVV